jgi:hypothetical protein
VRSIWSPHDKVAVASDRAQSSGEPERGDEARIGRDRLDRPGDKRVCAEHGQTDCPDEVWETDLWPDEAPTGPTPHGGLHGSASWFLAYHALLTLDYDLTAEFGPWEPPPPFDEHTYAFPNRVFKTAELLGYVDYCRGKVRQTLDALTEEMAAQPLPSAHRDHGKLFGVIVGSMPLHVVEHASQIRQFLTAAGVKVQPMPGDRGYAGVTRDGDPAGRDPSATGRTPQL